LRPDDRAVVLAIVDRRHRPQGTRFVKEDTGPCQCQHHVAKADKRNNRRMAGKLVALCTVNTPVTAEGVVDSSTPVPHRRAGCMFTTVRCSKGTRRLGYGQAAIDGHIEPPKCRPVQVTAGARRVGHGWDRRHT